MRETTVERREGEREGEGRRYLEDEYISLLVSTVLEDDETHFNSSFLFLIYSFHLITDRLRFFNSAEGKGREREGEGRERGEGVP